MYIKFYCVDLEVYVKEFSRIRVLDWKVPDLGCVV